jgi:hypothetical protein
VLIWMPGVSIRRIAFNIHKTAWQTSNTEMRAYELDYPNGTLATMMSPAISLNGSGADQTNLTRTPSVPRECLGFYMWCVNAATANPPHQYAQVLNIRLYGIADDDTWVSGGLTKGVVNDLAVNRMGMATNATINPATTGPILPVMWDASAPLSSLLDTLAEYEGRWWGVLERDGTGKWLMAFSPWGSGAGRAWTTTLAQVNGRPAFAGDVYNQARVDYKTLDGSDASVTVNAAPDPLAGTARSLVGGFPRTYIYTIPEDQIQTDGVLATKVANSILTDHNASQWTGSLELVSATLSGTETSAVRMRAGDTLTISDWPYAAKTFRIYETRHTQVGSTITIGRRAYAFEQAVAQIAKEAMQRTDF